MIETRRSKPSAFTLIELLVVIAIICKTTDVIDGESERGTDWGNTWMPQPAIGAVSVWNGPPVAYFQVSATKNTCQTYINASTYHTGVILAGLADGSVRAIAQGMSAVTYGLALIPNNGLPMPSDW